MSRFQAKNSASHRTLICTPNSYSKDGVPSTVVCSVSGSDNQYDEDPIVERCRNNDFGRKNQDNGHNRGNGRAGNLQLKGGEMQSGISGEEFARKIREYSERQGKIVVFNERQSQARHMVKAAATISSPVDGVADNCLQYMMTTRDGFTIFLREWLKPDDGSSKISRKHSSSTRALLMMPGFPHTAMLTWDRQVSDPALSKYYRMVTMEIRGHGDSSKPIYDSDFTAQKWADDVQDAITLLGLSQTVLMGHSYSGTIISRYLNIYGQSSLAGIVLSSAQTKADFTNPAWIVETLTANFLTYGLSLYNLSNDLGDYYRANHKFADDSYYKDILLLRYKADVGATDMLVPPVTRMAMHFPPNFADNSVLATITLPALIVHAKDNCGGDASACGLKSMDRIVPLQHAINNYNLLKTSSNNVTLKIINYVGHFCQAEDPSNYNKALITFLKSF